MAEDHEVVITCADDADMEGLARRLAAKGLTNGAALPSVGIITGHAAQDTLEGLRSEPGVTSVELSGGVQLPPPESDLQ